MKRYRIYQYVGDRDKPTISIKDIAFTIADNPMSDRMQRIIEIKDTDMADPLKRYGEIRPSDRLSPTLLGTDYKSPHLVIKIYER